MAVLVLPWVQPWAAGPSSAVQPWLVSAACAMLAFAAVGSAPPSGASLALLALAAWAALRPAGTGIEQYSLLPYAGLVLAAAGVARGWCQRGHGAQLLAGAWLLAAVLSAGIALLQYFGAAAALAPWVHAAEAGEAVSNLRQRNQLASLLVLGTAALLWLRAHAAIARGYLPLALLLGAALAATTSRTGLLQYLVIGVLAWCWRTPQRAAVLRLWGLVLLAYALASWALPWALEAGRGAAAESLWQRVQQVEACSSRRVLWSNVLALLAEKPLLGWGWGALDYAHFSHLYGEAPRFCDILDNAHNLPLHLAVELGLPAAVLFCALLAWGTWRARPWDQSDPARQLAWAALAVLAVHSLVEYPLWYGPFQLALGLAIGLLASTPAGTQPWPRALRGGLAGIGLAALAYAGWDYERVSQLYLAPEQRHARWRTDPGAHARRSWLFAQQVRFAELTLAPVTRSNLQWMDREARALLYYSPEPRVIERAIEAATLQERHAEAALQLARYRAAFPMHYARWRTALKRPLP